MEFSGRLRSLTAREPTGVPANACRLGYVEGAVSPEQINALSGHFPDIVCESVGSAWPERYNLRFDILIVLVDASSSQEMEAAIRRLKVHPRSLQTIVMLRNADVTNTRALSHAGAADVLPTPVSDASLALCLERLLRHDAPERRQGRKPGQVVVLIKAGGGVGATSLGVQATNLLAGAAPDPGEICFADLDLQFGAASLYFDLGEALSITDCLAVGNFLGETQWSSVLATHTSGAKVLAGPKELTALDALTIPLTEALVTALRRDFALTILDLPSVWTAWTNRVLQLADRVVMVTRLSVAHVHLVRRQLGILTLQKLDEVPLTLVCNAVTSDQQNMLPIKTAERSIGRAFDIVIPDDARVMGAALNEGLKIATVRRGTKLEKGIGLLASVIAKDALVQANRSASRI